MGFWADRPATVKAGVSIADLNWMTVATRIEVRYGGLRWVTVSLKWCWT